MDHSIKQVPSIELVQEAVRDGSLEKAHELWFSCVEKWARYQASQYEVFSQTDQEVLVDVIYRKFIRTVQSLRDPSRFKFVTNKLIRGCCNNEYKRIKRVQEKIPSVREYYNERKVENEKKEIIQGLVPIMEKMIELLPKEQRYLIHEYFIEKRPYRELAEELGVSISGVRLQILHILRELRFRMRSWARDYPEIADKLEMISPGSLQENGCRSKIKIEEVF